jgi:hypothetical protein
MTIFLGGQALENGIPGKWDLAPCRPVSEKPTYQASKAFLRYMVSFHHPKEI